MEFENLITLIQTISDASVTKFRYEQDGIKLCIEKDTAPRGAGHHEPPAGMVYPMPGAVQPMPGAVQPMPGAVQPMPGMAYSMQNPVMAMEGQADRNVQTDVPEKADNSGKMIKSPLIGKFYAAPAEDAQAFVAVGDHVKKGQIVAIVEAMKLMNEIESEFDGEVAEILVENGEVVEYGQPLFRII